MSFSLIFKPRAEAEIAEAFAWYDQPTIQQGKPSSLSLSASSGSSG